MFFLIIIPHFHFPDVGRVQVGADPEAHPQGEARHAAALRPQAAQNAGML